MALLLSAVIAVDEIATDELAAEVPVDEADLVTGHRRKKEELPQLP